MVAMNMAIFYLSLISVYRSQIGFCLTGSISLIFLKAVAWVCYCNKVIWVWWDQSLVD